MQEVSYNEEETFNLGFMCGVEAKKGDVFCLDGDLGVGKTVFAKGFAKGLKVEDEITSPTFTIVNEYEGKFKFYHFDMYRIEDIEQLYNIGFDEYVFGDGVCLIEWSQLVKEALPENLIKVTIKKDLSISEDYRKITIE